MNDTENYLRIESRVYGQWLPLQDDPHYPMTEFRHVHARLLKLARMYKGKDFRMIHVTIKEVAIIERQEEFPR